MNKTDERDKMLGVGRDWPIIKHDKEIPAPVMQLNFIERIYKVYTTTTHPRASV